MTKIDLDRFTEYAEIVKKGGTYGYNIEVKCEIRWQDLKAMIKAIRAAKHFTHPQTQILQVTAITAFEDLKEALEVFE